MIPKRLHTLLCSFAALICSAALTAEHPPEKLAFTVYDFPPEIIKTATEPQGPIIDHLMRILDEAGYTPDWIASSLTEETQLLDENLRAFCTTGRIYTPERGEKWRFVPYILLNISSDAFLVREHNIPLFKKHTHVLDVLSDPSLKGVFVNGGSYGKPVNDVLKTKRSWLNVTATSNVQTINLVQANRADYTIVPLKTWVSVIDRKSHKYDLINLTYHIQGTQDGPDPIFLACSKKTPTSTVQALSDAMGKLGFKKPPFEMTTSIVAH